MHDRAIWTLNGKGLSSVSRDELASASDQSNSEGRRFEDGLPTTITSCRDETKVSVLTSATSLVDLRLGDWTKVSRGDELEDDMLLLLGWTGGIGSGIGLS